MASDEPDQLPDFDKIKHKTMMRMGELQAMDEEQRKMILEMVKEGSLTIEEAHEEVKRIRPKTMSGKYIGSSPCLPSLVTAGGQDNLAKQVTLHAMDYIKRNKIATVKSEITFSTIGVRFCNGDGTETLDNESISGLLFQGIHSARYLVLVFQHSKLGLAYIHVIQFAKAKEATEALEVVLERKALASQAKVFNAITEEPAADDDDDDEDDEASEEEDGPFACHHLFYLGSMNADNKEGERTVVSAVGALNEQIKDRREGKGGKAVTTADAIPVSLVFSAEGLRVVDRFNRELIRNVLSKAISFQTVLSASKGDIYTFIEVDDRRDENDCAVFICDKAVKKQAEMLQADMDRTIELGKNRKSNPFRAVGGEREVITGPLTDIQLRRKQLRAVKAIGAGQFGQVYLSEYHSPADSDAGKEEPELRAIKMLRGKASEDDKKEFLREGETMLKIGNHDNLVKLLGVVISKKPMLMVLEYCQYGDLSDVLRACRRKKVALKLGEQLYLASQLAKGMQYIASKHYVHMDLAARNCLLGPNSVLKIADFGLTRPHDAGKNYHKQQGVMKLSIRWLAMDAFKYKIFSEKSDVWSFGVTTWEILSYGRQPYSGVELKHVMKAVIDGRRLKQPKGCPDDVWDVVFSCWIREPNRRPTFRQLRKAFDFLLKEHQVDVASLRDVGALMNAELTENIKALTLKRATGTGTGLATKLMGVIEE
eukprot:TRINITY_DN11985_c0_g1_i2.p1 TRINITY_DN11985_c0_g1~~TRINITY_DN11985_c0_g1_i2.p1  ORF type:complete len:710 (+),score=227.01 TRINITY_DN11985_c0_g1_i2:92-2221(+)